jgi:SulP family sulfate permease
VYSVYGALFSASSNDLVHRFDHTGDPQSVVVDLSDAHVRDASTVAVLDAVTARYASRGETVEVVGPTGHSADRYERHTGQLAASH